MAENTDAVADVQDVPVAVESSVDATERITEKWIAYSTNIGTRKYQQDAAKIPEAAQLKRGTNICVLSDGMGGMQGGEKASALCVETLFEDFYAGEPIENYPRFFEEEIEKVDRLVTKLADDDGNPIESGATLVSVIFDEGKLYWASVGDSRIYILRGNEIVQVNEDHNYYLTLRQKVQAGEITQEQADAEPSREALISYIGMNGVTLMDVNREPFLLEPGDMVILCSDGLYKSLDEDAIQLIASEYPHNIPLAAHMLTTVAVENRVGGQDNTTVIVAKFNDNKKTK